MWGSSTEKEVKTVVVIDVKGDIISNDDKWVYDWFEWDSTCPNDVKNALINAEPGEEIEVHVNSGGGSVMAGQEMYSLLRGNPNVTIVIQSMAGSAAGVVAMAGKNKISPVAMVMIHNVSMHGASGDYHDMQKNAEILKQMNASMAAAYTEKSGKSQEEILRLMDKETWLTANQCLEYGFVDEIIKEEKSESYFTNSYSGMRLTDELRERAVQEKAKQELLKDLDFYGV